MSPETEPGAPGSLSILLLAGDAEARLLGDAEAVLQAVLPERNVRLTRAWAPRPDALGVGAPVAPPEFAGEDANALLELPHQLVVIALLPAVWLTALRHRDGGVFLAHRGLRQGWSEELAARIAAECAPEPALTPGAAAAAWEAVIVCLQAQGAVVAVCTAFRHVNAAALVPPGDVASLRELIRRVNLDAANLSRRTGCFVLDFDRPFAHEGGSTLGVDCFGGEGRAAELALDEFASLVLDALPDAALPLEYA
jgi:hypothetical protein